MNSDFYRRHGKRALDLVLVVVAAPVLLPLSIAVASAVRLVLGRPVLFRQERPGLDGRLFTLYKFRTMTRQTDAAGRPLSDGQRLTRFGRLLRRTSLDELPELVNVLRGEMSLVGPRPLLPQYLDRYDSEQARRHDVRPGATGWAQVRGRNALSWPAKLAFDVWYVDHVSLLLDLRILVETIVQVISGSGVSATGHDTMPEFRGDERPV